MVDENGHLMGAIGVAILAKNSPARSEFDFNVEHTDFTTKEVTCGKCSNNCEIVCAYKENKRIDAWGFVVQSTVSNVRRKK